MVTVLSIVHILSAIFMIFVVLLQAGKGAGMGAAFGGSSQTMFGGGGGMSLMGKLTATAAAVFMLSSMTLSYVSSQTDSIVDELQEEAVQAVEEAAPTEEAKPAEGTAASEEVKAEEKAPAGEAKAEEAEAVEPEKKTEEKPAE